MSSGKITAVGANIAEKTMMIWNVADVLRGPFKPHEGGHQGVQLRQIYLVKCAGYNLYPPPIPQNRQNGLMA